MTCYQQFQHLAWLCQNLITGQFPRFPDVKLNADDIGLWGVGSLTPIESKCCIQIMQIQLGFLFCTKNKGLHYLAGADPERGGGLRRKMFVDTRINALHIKTGQR